MKIISGGQTGADRAALEIAHEIGIETGGWAPLGWLTEDGADPSLASFGLQEATSARYQIRTDLNVRDSDGTAIFGHRSPGTNLIGQCCRNHGKPCINNPTADELREWITEHRIEVLNVAGNRATANPGIGEHVKRVLRDAFGPVT